MFCFHSYKVPNRQNSTLFFRDVYISGTATKENEEIDTKVSVVVPTRTWGGDRLQLGRSIRGLLDRWSCSIF